MFLPVMLSYAVKEYTTRRHVDTHSERFSSKENFNQPSGKEHLDALFHDRKEPSVMHTFGKHNTEVTMSITPTV